MATHGIWDVRSPTCPSVFRGKYRFLFLFHVFNERHCGQINPMTLMVSYPSSSTRQASYSTSSPYRIHTGNHLLLNGPSTGLATAFVPHLQESFYPLLPFLHFHLHQGISSRSTGRKTSFSTFPAPPQTGPENSQQPHRRLPSRYFLFLHLILTT